MSALTSVMRQYSSLIQVTPLSLVILFFLLGPVIVILIFSFYTFNGFIMVSELTTDNYVEVFTSYNT